MLLLSRFRCLHNFINLSVILCFLLFSYIYAVEHELLQSKDVNKIMQQIFNQHVDKNEISDSILKKSFVVYVDQFDPKRIYLTEKDVQPFLQLSKTQLANIMRQYKDQQYPEYQDLNNVIQASIQKSRKIREQLISKNAYQLFQASSNLSVTDYENWRDPDLKLTFAKDDSQLKERIRHAIIQFVAEERKRYGNDVVSSHLTQTFQILDKKFKEHENQYMFTLENGQPMSEAEKQNAFSMHILKSLANSLDSHTTILNSSEAYDMRLRLEKKVDGVGIVLQPANDGGFIISQLVAGGAALQSGQIKLGDKLIEINGMPIQKMALDHVMELLRPENGAKVGLVLQRVVDNSKQILNVQLKSGAIAVNEDRVQVSYEPYKNGIIGKIKLDTFYQSDDGTITSTIDLRDAIKKLNKHGNLLALVLDFRENSGGFLSQAVKVAGLFITNGVVVVSKYFNGEEHFYRDMDGKMAYDGPLIILTSKVTASAAEIVAQALQDYGVALIVGDTHTYGKGTIQNQTVTDNQNATYFKVTVGKYYTVSGKTPQIQGVKADVVVPSQFVHDTIGEEYLEYPLKPDSIADSFNDPLKDVPSTLKSWYLHYYVPTIQHKTTQWQSMIPELKKNSEYRITANNDYQVFLKGSTNIPLSKRSHVEDLQLNEAVNIAKDMVNLEGTQRHGELIEHESQAQTAALPAEAVKK
jgi:carboxyl-terminal processing protease